MPNMQLPDYLATYDRLEQHFRANLDGLSSVEKGRRFARFVQRLLPQTPLGLRFERPDLNERESNDEGVDLIAKGRDGRSTLYIQARLWIDRTESIDSIFSKFKNFNANLTGSRQMEMFPATTPTIEFAVVTLSPLKSLLSKYGQKRFASQPFFETLRGENRFHRVDGEDMLPVLRGAFGKLGDTPNDIVLEGATEFVQHENVFLGIISSRELRRLYTQFGDALFFENIRDFLGISPADRSGRTTPNNEIARTVTDQPSRLLERNNGIVMRAATATADDSRRRLILHTGSVVNGCQTTMCVVQNAQVECFLPIKVVQTDEPWVIAKAANYQNQVGDIDLDLARHFRPQLVKRAAVVSGVHLEHGGGSAFSIIDAIYERSLAYHETRALYIGLFSRTPNNVLANNYTELNRGLIEQFYENDPYGEMTFATLFDIQSACQDGLAQARTTFKSPEYARMFDRFYDDEKPTYRSFIAILALCGETGIDVSRRESDHLKEFARMQGFFDSVRAGLTARKEQFLRYYVLATKLWMQEVMSSDTEESKIRRDMSVASREANFSNLFMKLCMEADIDPLLSKPAEAPTS